MMSSLIPSEKYSCSGSPDMLVNGKIAIAACGRGLAVSDCGSLVTFACAVLGCQRQIRTPIDILDIDLAAVLEVNVDPIADALVDNRGNANTAGLGGRFKARGDVHAVAINVIPFDDHIT